MFFIGERCNTTKKPQLWATGDWQPHHDNPPTHASCLVQRFLVKRPIAQVTQPTTAQILHPETSVFSQN